MVNRIKLSVNNGILVFSNVFRIHVSSCYNILVAFIVYSILCTVKAELDIFDRYEGSNGVFFI